MVHPSLIILAGLNTPTTPSRALSPSLILKPPISRYLFRMERDRGISLQIDGCLKTMAMGKYRWSYGLEKMVNNQRGKV